MRASRVVAALVALFSLVAVYALVGTEERPAPGGVYREAVVGQPLSLNPLLHPLDPITRDVSRLVYAGLVRLTANGEVAGDLATAWTRSEDGRSYTFQMNPRALWHDGQPVTSADVLATVAMLQSPSYAGAREVGALWRTVRAEAPDAYTVRFHLAEPYAPFIEACSVPILPRHLFGTDGTANLVEHPASYAPVGAGPFRLSSIDAEGVVLTRYSEYAGSRVLLDEIDLRFYPDAPSALQALGAGAVDGLAGLAREELQRLPNGDQLAVRDIPLPGHQTLLVINHANPALKDPAVRRAISLSVVRSSLVEGPMRGKAVAAYGPVPASSWAYRKEIEIEPDPSLAQTLLERAGWVGGPVRSRNGRQLRLQIVAAAEDREIAVAEAIARQLESAGFRIDIQPVERLDLYRERLIPHRYDLALLGIWLGTVGPDPYPLWHSSQRQDGFNFAGYESAVADDLLAAARRENDPGRRLAALWGFQQLWADEVPSVVLASPLMLYAMADHVRGVRFGVVPEPGARFQSVAEWYLYTQRVPGLLR